MMQGHFFPNSLLVINENLKKTKRNLTNFPKTESSEIAWSRSVNDLQADEMSKALPQLDVAEILEDVCFTTAVPERNGCPT